MDTGQQLENIFSQIRSKEEDLNNKLIELREIQNRISSIKINVSNITNNINQLKKQYENLLIKNNELRVEFNTASKSRKSSINSEIKNNNEQIKSIQRQVATRSVSMTESLKNLQNLESSSDVNSLMNQISKLETELEDLRKQHGKLMNDLAIENAKASPVQDVPIEITPSVVATSSTSATKVSKKRTKKTQTSTTEITPSIASVAQIPTASGSRGGGGKKPPKPPAPPTPPTPQPSEEGSSKFTPEQLELQKTRIRDKKAAEKEARFEKSQREDELAAKRKLIEQLREQELEERAERERTVLDKLASIALERLATEARILQRSKDIEAAFKERDAELAEIRKARVEQEQQEAQERADRDKSVLNALAPIALERLATEERILQRSKDIEAAFKERDAELKEAARLQKEYEQETIQYWMGIKDSEKRRRKFENDIFKAHEAALKMEEDKIKKQQQLNKEAISKVSSFTKHIVSMMQRISNTLLSMTDYIRKVQQQFGINAGVAVRAVASSFAQSFNSFFGTGPFVRTKQILEASQGFQEEFGGILTGEAAKNIAQRGVSLGITPEQQAMARRVFMTQTGGDREKAIAAESKFIAEFEAKNLTAKDAMKAIQQYSELIARNGSRFQTSFARAAVDAKKIGVDLGKVDQIGDNIIGNFEGFLESQAELGAMGFGFDTSRLAQLSETGDTGALFNELRSQLAATGKDITKLRRSEQLALSQAFGISMTDIQRLAGATTGSGERTMESLQEKSNSLLSSLVNFAEKLFVGINLLLTVVSGVVAGLLAGIEFNTAMLAAGKAVGGIGGAFGRLMSGPLAGAAGSAMKGIGIAGLATSSIGASMGAYGSAKEGKLGWSLLAALGAAGAGAGAGAMYGSIGGLPGALIGALIGGALGLGGTIVGSLVADDMVSKSGYGKRTLVTPTATVALNDKDNVVAYADDMVSREAGVNLLSKGAIASEASNAKATFVSLDTSKLEAKLDNLATKIASMGIYMDGNKVGKVLVNSSDATSVGVFRTQAKVTL